MDQLRNVVRTASFPFSRTEWWSDRIDNTRHYRKENMADHLQIACIPQTVHMNERRAFSPTDRRLTYRAGSRLCLPTQKSTIVSPTWLRHAMQLNRGRYRCHPWPSCVHPKSPARKEEAKFACARAEASDPAQRWPGHFVAAFDLKDERMWAFGRVLVVRAHMTIWDS